MSEPKYIVSAERLAYEAKASALMKSQPKRREPTVAQLRTRIEAVERHQKLSDYDIAALAKDIVVLQKSGVWKRIAKLLHG
jgi:hypothetical protein